MISSSHLRDTLAAYLDRHPDDIADLSLVLELLAKGADLADRRSWQGHVTVSGIVLNPNGQVLLIHHKATGKQLPPGGHLEPEDETLHAAVVREVTEETGLPLAALTLLDGLPLHADVHVIPAHEHRGEPDHFHFDLRYLLSADAQVLRPQLDEVEAARWADPAELGDPVLRARVQDLITAT